MQVADLSPEQRQQLAAYALDTLREKHEGWSWDIPLNYSAFFTFDGYEVLLPIAEEDRANVSLIWLAVGADGNVLTLYIEDTTTWNEIQTNPAYQDYREPAWMKPRYTDFIAICEKVPGQPYYITTLYHQGSVSREPGRGPERS